MNLWFRALFSVLSGKADRNWASSLLFFSFSPVCSSYWHLSQAKRIFITKIHGRMNYKDTKPYMSAFLKIDLLTDFVALCLTDFVDWRYIHSEVCIFDPACELLSPWTKELYLCTVAPLLYLLSDLLPPPTLFSMYSTQVGSYPALFPLFCTG
jgi:hypothetical protein